ncbi:MAG: putative polynucleotide kinase [Solivirus sp.]|uniref:Putative polynucleotide kinase n=1 Tax=Solivirus sp. TaxID=2487772 RepID=A0A3G5AFU9_9VIRU|nr:MAG: putative polynucleotide kinase [Solivirus sp.]
MKDSLVKASIETTQSMSNNNFDSEEIKEICREALKLPAELNEFWSLLSFYPREAEKPRLALVHYNEKFDPNKSAHIPLFFVRGTVIDLKTKVVIADSYGHTERLPAYSEITKNEEGKIVFQTLRKVFMTNSSTENAKYTIGEIVLDPENTTFYVGNEGVILRVFKFDGRVFYSTQKSLYGETSFFGEVSNNFFQMYRRLYGPESRGGSQELFNERHAFSPYCYVFLVVDNKLRLASSTRDNRIVFIGVREMWPVHQYAREAGDPYFCESADDFKEPVKIISLSNSSARADPDDDRLVKQNPISIELANAILFPAKNAFRREQSSSAASVGTVPRQMTLKYNEDHTQLTGVEYTPAKYETNKLGGGDFVVMYIKTPSGMFVYHVESEPFMYRIEMTKEDPNFYHNFVGRAPFFYKNEISKALLQGAPPVITGITGEALDLGTSMGRLYWWNSILYETCRISIREEVKKYTRDYLTAITKVAEFILSNEKILDLEERKRLDERTLGRFENLRAITKHADFRNGPQLVILKEMLHRETGGAFYKMATSVKKVEELRKKKAATEKKE